jgi:hypothetical protein
MSKAKLLAATCVAAFALSALSSAAAFGAWDVNGTKLVGTAALAHSARVVAATSLRILGTSINVGCTASEVGVVGGELVAPDELQVKSLVFSLCKSGEGCKLLSTVIATLPLHGLAHPEEGSAAAYVQILPSTSKTIAVLQFESSTCALSGAVPLTAAGSDIDILIHRSQPSVLHLLLTYSLLGLKLGSTEVTMPISWSELGLQSGQTWSFL